MNRIPYLVLRSTYSICRGGALQRPRRGAFSGRVRDATAAAHPPLGMPHPFTPPPISFRCTSPTTSVLTHVYIYIYIYIYVYLSIYLSIYYLY